MATDPFAATGGGVQLDNGDWVPNDHPLAAQKQQQTQSQPASDTTYQPPPLAPGTPGATTLDTQAQNAQTYSNTPGAPTGANTANAGTQDTVRNTYLQQATQGTNVTRDDPNVRAQADAFAGRVGRERDQYLAQAAERNSASGLANSGRMQMERRLASERAGQQTGAFEADLIGREMTNRRQEIQTALGQLTGIISQDQQLALQRELAQLDADLKRLGIASGEGIAGDELSLRRDLGFGGLNLDALRLAQNDRQFADQLGFNIGDRQAYYDNLAMQNLLGGG